MLWDETKGKRKKFFFLPKPEGEVVASLRLPQELETKTMDEAIVEAAKRAPGVLCVQITEF